MSFVWNGLSRPTTLATSWMDGSSQCSWCSGARITAFRRIEHRQFGFRRRMCTSIARASTGERAGGLGDGPCVRVSGLLAIRAQRSFVLGCRDDSSLGFFRFRKANVALPLVRWNIPAHLLGIVCREKSFDEVYHLGRVIFCLDLTRKVAPVFRARLGFHGAILLAQLMLVTKCCGQN